MYSVRFMLINVNENFFVGLLMQLIPVQSNHKQNFSFLKQVETIAISPFNRTKVCTCVLEKFAHFTSAIVFFGCRVTCFSIAENFRDVASTVFTKYLKM